MTHRSPLFQIDTLPVVKQRIKEFFAAQEDFLTESSVTSPRAVGDAVQRLLEANFATMVAEFIQNYSSGFARRAMADLAFIDSAGFYHIVDVKTHRLNTTFNMPNLTSVERLARFYEDDNNHFDILILAYHIDGLRLNIERIDFVPIEYLDWRCLTLGALGWGQLQIKDANEILLDLTQTRKSWMLSLCDKLLEFYPAEIAKINERIEHFRVVRDKWAHKPDNA